MKARILLFFLLISFGAAQAMEITAAAQDAAPKYVIGTDNTIGGLCIDIMRAIEKIDSDIKFVGADTFVPFKRIENRLESGLLDVFFGFARTPERELKYRFVDLPLYKWNYVMVVRKDDPIVINGFEDIRAMKSDSTILALFGTADVDYLKSVGGLTIDESGRSPQSMLEKLVARRARFVYYHRAGLDSIIEKEGVRDKVRLLPVSFKDDLYHYAVFSKAADPKKVLAVEKALKKLNDSGRLQTIFRTYVQP